MKHQASNKSHNQATMLRSLFAVCAVLTLAFPAAAQMNFPTPSSRIQFSDWIQECYSTDKGNFCQAYHRVLMNQGRDIALVFTLYPKSGQRRSYDFQIAVPLGVDLSKNAVLSVGADFRATLPITRCTQQGCLSEGTISGPAMSALLEGTAAAITVVNPNSGEFTVPISLAGFGDVLQAIDAAAPQTPESPAQEGDQQNGAESDDALKPQTNEEVGPKPDPQLAPVTSTQGDE